MNQYYKKLNDIFEDRAVLLINNSQNNFIAERNNLRNNEIDLVINKNTYIDVQYSFDFKRYGDVRIDVLSAFSFKDDKNSLNLIKSSKKNNCFDDFSENLNIGKYGKYLDSNISCDGVFYFLFNSSKPLINKIPDIEKIKNLKISKIVYIPTSIIKYELNNFWLDNKNKFKINDKIKNNLNENHLSAFVAFNLDSLVKKYEIPIFHNREDLKNNFERYFISTSNFLNYNKKSLKNN